MAALAPLGRATEDPPAGLSEAEAQARLRRDGPNELPRGGRRSVARILLDTLREPMFALLLGAGGLYFALGDPAEAALLAAFACLSVGIAVVQEARTERALEALRDLSPDALVRPYTEAEARGIAAFLARSKREAETLFIDLAKLARTGAV